jgi:hypothetical protein
MRSNMQRLVRFQTSLRDADAATSLGVFRAAGKLLESQVLDSASAEWTEEICDWFNAHVKVPRLRARQWRAVFWFRAEHCYLIQRVWDLALVLEKHGVFVELVHTTNPGRVCYEDELQVAAIPWRGR